MSEVNNITLEQVQRAAEDRHCDLVLADDFTLLLDFDDSLKPPDLREKLEVLERQFMFTVADTETWVSRSGHGCHVKITMGKPFRFSTRLIFQMFLGSDPLRELLALWRSTLPQGLSQSALFRPKKKVS